MRLLGAAVLIPIACCCCTASRASEQTIVILDVTAQMGAQLGRKPKLEWVKPGLSAAVSKLDPASAFALWAFGSNPQKKCEDAGELVPLQAAGGASAALDKALAALQPKAARAPAIGTLQAALKSIGSPDKPVSAIVIAGTGDDCTGDICSVAGRLHTAYPNAKLNVLGVGMSGRRRPISHARRRQWAAHSLPSSPGPTSIRACVRPCRPSRPPASRDLPMQISRSQQPGRLRRMRTSPPVLPRLNLPMQIRQPGPLPMPRSPPALP